MTFYTFKTREKSRIREWEKSVSQVVFLVVENGDNNRAWHQSYHTKNVHTKTAHIVLIHKYKQKKTTKNEWKDTEENTNDKRRMVAMKINCNENKIEAKKQKTRIRWRMEKRANGRGKKMARNRWKRKMREKWTITMTRDNGNHKKASRWPWKLS